MIKVLFVCHGNICRSPMAEFALKDMAKKRGLGSDIYAESAATSSEEIGSPVHPGTVRKLYEHGISCKEKRARRLERENYEEFDHIICMDRHNVKNTLKACSGDPEGKIRLLLECAGLDGEVADPWYTGDFDATWSDVVEGCSALLDELEKVL